MAVVPDGVVLRHNGSDQVRGLLDALCDAYADAYGVVPGEDTAAKTAAFRDRATKALDAINYDLVTAEADGLVGFVFGYSLRPDRGWWDGLAPDPPEGFTVETGDRTVVLAEIEVRRAWQGKGLGRALHDEFLGSRHEQRSLALIFGGVQKLLAKDLRDGVNVGAGQAHRIEVAVAPLLQLLVK